MITSELIKYLRKKGYDFEYSATGENFIIRSPGTITRDELIELEMMIRKGYIPIEPKWRPNGTRIVETKKEDNR